jgi:hypothetical protein
MTTPSEIPDLEERLRQAELGPDPAFFEEHRPASGCARSRI